MRGNRFYRGAKIDEDAVLGILRGIADDQTASETAADTRVSVRTVNAIFVRIRQRMIDRCIADPEAFAGAGRNLLNALARKGLSGMTSPEEQLALFHEHLRCVGKALLARIADRGLRPADYPQHAFELYLRAKVDSPEWRFFLSVPDRFFDPALRRCVASWQAGDGAAFKKQLAALPPAVTKADDRQYRFHNLYNELYEMIWRNPL